MTIGTIGVWLGSLALLPAPEERAAARELERLGYATLWFGESPINREAMAHAALLLAGTESATIATGIASIWARDGTAAANAAAALGEAFPGRFVLGLGVSHAPLTALRGRDYTRPLTEMRRFLDEMDGASYVPPAPSERPPRVLAALLPRMLRLAAERTDGAHPYLVTPEHTREARAVLRDGQLLAPEQGVVLETDPAQARAAARKHLHVYLGLDNYRASWRRLGFSDPDFEHGGSDRLVDALVAWGTADAIRARVEEHLDAGADHVAVQALGPEPLEQLRQLAPVLLRR